MLKKLGEVRNSFVKIQNARGKREIFFSKPNYHGLTLCLLYIAFYSELMIMIIAYYIYRL